MPRTIDEGFRDFHTKLTPSSFESDTAKVHRASIKRRIETDFGLRRFWRTGSFGNGTSISGYSDVDYIASISRESLSSNSTASLTKLRNSLAARFPNTGVRTSCPAVVVPFGSSAKETTEVTPADYIRTENGFKIYRIPDCAGGWMKASPDAHNGYVSHAHSKLSNKVKPLIRFIKAWKYYQDVPISSFYLELRVAKYASAEQSIHYSIDVKAVFALLYQLNLAQITDPMGVSGYISPCRSDAALATAKSKLSTALNRATKAREAEEGGNIKDAFCWWNRLYAYKFPSYYG